MAKDNSAAILGIVFGIGLVLYINKKSGPLFPSAGSTGVDDATNAKLTYLENWAGGNDSLNAMVVGVAAEGINSINQLYVIAVADAANQGMTAAQQTFWNNLISKYA